ncbi:hypothetical protein BGZ72_000198 [Mortierella alpina]|nr:hypothetical protein BGZ72_000198 [Mortierella alpina]
MNPRLDDVADLDAIAHLIPKSITIGAALDAASAPTTGLEIVYNDEVVDDETAAITPLTINGVAYPLISSTVNYVITRFAIQGFFFRNDTRKFEETLTFAEAFVKEFEMETVIKEEIPRFRYRRRQA